VSGEWTFGFFALALLLFQLVVHRVFVLNALTLFIHLCPNRLRLSQRFFPCSFFPHFTACKNYGFQNYSSRQIPSRRKFMSATSKNRNSLGHVWSGYVEGQTILGLTEKIIRLGPKASRALSALTALLRPVEPFPKKDVNIGHYIASITPPPLKAKDLQIIQNNSEFGEWADQRNRAAMLQASAVRRSQ